MSASPQFEMPAPLSLAQLQQSAQEQLPWLWHGYLARGCITLLVSQGKSGKTTLLSMLLDRLRAGGTLAGLPVSAGKAVVLTEESAKLWLGRSQRFDYAEHVLWHCRPFGGKPSAAQWRAFLDQMEALHRQIGLDLLAIDPLASFLPGRDENNAGAILEYLASLQQLTNLGMAVLLPHHPRKQAAPDGQAARGSGALTGFADIVIEMHWFNRADNTDRRRQLLAWSRFEATPRQRVIELNDAATDYTCLGDCATVADVQLDSVLYAVLGSAAYKLSIKEIFAQWPATGRRPNQGTLWRWLERAVAAGHVRRDGDGHKRHPFRYWLPEREAVWRQDPLLALRLDDENALRECLRNLASF